MTLDEAIKHAEEVAEEQEKLYRLCPGSESWIFHCDGTDDCKTLENGKNKGCLKCAEEHEQLAEWLKELKQLREQTSWIPVNERLPEPYQECLFTVEAFHWANEPVTYKVIQKAYGGERDFIAWMPLPEIYKEEAYNECRKANKNFK